MPFAIKAKSHSEMDHRKAVLALRWLLVILASYLTLFSYIGTEEFPLVSGVAVAFALSNLLLTFVPARVFAGNRAHAAIAILDVIFVSATLYLLRVPGNFLYVAFVGIF